MLEINNTKPIKINDIQSNNKVITTSIEFKEIMFHSINNVISIKQK